jgi:hypothetical protein
MITDVDRRNVESYLAAAGEKVLAARRPFDVAAGLRRLAEEAGLRRLAEQAGFVPPPIGSAAPSVSRAQRYLSVVVRWTLKNADASVHIERLAEVVGRHGSESFEAWLTVSEVNETITGAQAFACMLYLADHHESAQFWWQLAAGAGSRAAAYCLHLHHLGMGERPESDHWLTQLQLWLDGPDDDFFRLLRSFADYVDNNHPPSWTPCLNREVARLSTSEEAQDTLVCRPDRELATRLQHCAH